MPTQRLGELQFIIVTRPYILTTECAYENNLHPSFPLCVFDCHGRLLRGGKTKADVEAQHIKVKNMADEVKNLTRRVTDLEGTGGADGGAVTDQVQIIDDRSQSSELAIEALTDKLNRLSTRVGTSNPWRRSVSLRQQESPHLAPLHPHLQRFPTRFPPLRFRGIPDPVPTAPGSSHAHSYASFPCNNPSPHTCCYSNG